MQDKLWNERILLWLTIFLALTGVVMVYSASSIMADKRFHDSFFFLKRHTVYALTGITVMIAISKIDYQIAKKVAYPFLFFTLALLLLLLIPGIGTEVGGATRWLRLGPLSIQPSEVAKLALIIFMAYSFSKKEEKGEMKDLKKGFLPYVLVLMFFLVPMLRQPDFGTAMTITSIFLIMIFVAGARLSYITTLVISVAGAAALLIAGAEYRRKRILSFLDPWDDPLDTGFQIIQSFLAFGSGGFAGRGLGEGRQKLFYLPEPHTDFILPVIGEEMGFLGVMTVVLIFGAVVALGIKAALSAKDSLGCYLAIGITSMIGLQAIINMWVVMGLLPTKGLPLPFISYGGTSLIVNMIGVGILAGVIERSRE